MSDGKRHNIYGEAWIFAGLEVLARLNRQEGRIGRSASELVSNDAKKLLRANANRLRKAGHDLPDELFLDPARK